MKINAEIPVVGNSKTPELSSFGADDGAFSFEVKRAMDMLSLGEKEATQLSGDFAADPSTDLHRVLLSTTKADISLRSFVTLRNRVLDSYRQVMNFA